MYIRISRQDIHTLASKNIFKFVGAISLADFRAAERNGTCDVFCLEQSWPRVLMPPPAVGPRQISSNNNISTQTASSVTSLDMMTTATTYDTVDDEFNPLSVICIALGVAGIAVLFGALCMCCIVCCIGRSVRKSQTKKNEVRNRHASVASSPGGSEPVSRNDDNSNHLLAEHAPSYRPSSNSGFGSGNAMMG